MKNYYGLTWRELLVVAACLTFGLEPCLQAVGATTDSEWSSLFDGQTTAGWRGIGKSQFPEKGWTVEEGCLRHIKGGGGGDIITTKSFTNFDFQWEWKLGPGANGGIKYMLIEKRGPIGHEYQLLDDVRRSPSKNSTGSLYDILPPKNPPLRPAGEWNQSRVLVAGNRVEHWLNGVKVLEYELGSEPLKSAVASSKFKKFPGFGDKVTGPILLQDHGGEMWFRNLRIRELPTDYVLASAGSTSEDWQSLFDGQTPAHWRGFKQTGFPQIGWSVEHGYLHAAPKGGGGDIITVQKYNNFEFAWEWRASFDCNSGVKYLIHEERGAVGPEYQILDDVNNAEGKRGAKWSTAGVYDVLGASGVQLRPLGEFNESRIRVQGRHVEHWLNGTKVLAYELGSPEFQAAVAQSKFKNNPSYGTKSTGHILLQDHGHEVWFRNLKIRELPKP